MSNIDNDVFERWSKFLDPEQLRLHLISASLYLAAWETFETAVISRVRDFYWNGFDEKGETVSPEYDTEVLSKDKSPFRALMIWFRDSGAIVDADFQIADRARQHRNEIAHEIPKFVFSERSVDLSLFGELCALLNKVEVWWIRNIEIPINSDFDGQDTDSIPDSEILSGRMMMLGMIFNIATGEESESRRYYEAFAKEALKGPNSTAQGRRAAAHPGFDGHTNAAP
jgi:hypothetical protein